MAKLTRRSHAVFCMLCMAHLEIELQNPNPRPQHHEPKVWGPKRRLQTEPMLEFKQRPALVIVSLVCPSWRSKVPAESGQKWHARVLLQTSLIAACTGKAPLCTAQRLSTLQLPTVPVGPRAQGCHSHAMVRVTHPSHIYTTGHTYTPQSM